MRSESAVLRMIPCLHPTPEGVILAIHVQPRASANAVVGLHGEALKVRLTSPPVEGAANRLCIEFFSKLLGLPKCDVILASGDKSRQKRLLLKGADPQLIARLLMEILSGKT